VAERCATVTCPAGQTCADGACVDACAGATCPVGERCVAGACVPVPVMDAGVSRDVVLPSVDLGAREDVVDAATPMDLGAEGGRVTLDVNDRGRSGCSCRVGSGVSARGVLPFALLALCARRRRRVRCGSSAARGCATRSPL